MRVENSDAVLIVTSGEFMSIYAANNIIKGLANYKSDRPRLLGLILNCKGIEKERETVERFAATAGTRVVACIPRDSLFKKSETKCATLSELFPNTSTSSILKSLAELVVYASKGKEALTDPVPLSDRQLSELAAGIPVYDPPNPEPKQERPPKHLHEGDIMRSCAGRGAFSTISTMGDCAAVIHGPSSCGFIFTAWSKSIGLGPSGSPIDDYLPADNAFVTGMDEKAAIFGGESLLRKQLDSALTQGFDTVYVISCCVPSIIGDDIEKTLDDYRDIHPGKRFFLLDSQGDIMGDYAAGESMALNAMISLMDPGVKPVGGAVNLIRGTQFDRVTVSNMSTLNRMLGIFGLRTNCRLLIDASSKDVQDFGRASIVLSTSDSPNARSVTEKIGQRLSRNLEYVPVPVGLNQYLGWLDRIAGITGMMQKAETEKKRVRAEYSEFIRSHRIDGRKVILSNIMGRDVSWIQDLLEDMGADLVVIGQGMKNTNGTDTRRSRTKYGYSMEELVKDVDYYAPDLVIGDMGLISDLKVRYLRSSRTGYAMDDVYSFGEKICNAFKVPLRQEGWRRGFH